MSDEQPQKPAQPPAAETPKMVPEKPPPPDIVEVKAGEEIGDKITCVPPSPPLRS